MPEWNNLTEETVNARNLQCFKWKEFRNKMPLFENGGKPPQPPLFISFFLFYEVGSILGGGGGWFSFGGAWLSFRGPDSKCEGA